MLDVAGGSLVAFNAEKYVNSVYVYWLQWVKFLAMHIWLGEISDSQHMKTHKNQDSDIKHNINYLEINPFNLEYNIFYTQHRSKQD